ncbi:MAG: cupredoxin domain-containing protein [Candidatus Zixiibacteriota bacterium]
MITKSPIRISQKQRLLVIFFAAGILVALGCGTPGSEVPISETTAQITAANVQEVAIQMESYYFEPSRINVIVDVPVRLHVTNETLLAPHNFSLYAPEAGMSVDADISHGETVAVEFTPTKTGEYTFYCDAGSHETQGMVGTLVVRLRN